MEDDFALVECMGGRGQPAASEAAPGCRLAGNCRLQGALSQAMQAWMAVLDAVTLADLVAPADTVQAVSLAGLRRGISRR